MSQVINQINCVLVCTQYRQHLAPHQTNSLNSTSVCSIHLATHLASTSYLPSSEVSINLICFKWTETGIGNYWKDKSSNRILAELCTSILFPLAKEDLQKSEIQGKVWIDFFFVPKLAFQVWHLIACSPLELYLSKIQLLLLLIHCGNLASPIWVT